MEERMSHPEEYDVVVLGSGAAGKLLAWTLAAQALGVPVLLRLADGRHADRHAATGQQLGVRRGGVLDTLVGVVDLGPALKLAPGIGPVR
jgi:choline dehydrogenase-like flavoprotein